MRKILLLIIFFTTVSLTIFLLWSVYRSQSFRTLVSEKIVQPIIPSNMPVGLLTSLLGLDRPHFYLLLFLNNTELRPAGGFIGSYAIVKVENGALQLLKVEGTEILDNSAPNFISPPPDALKTYLGIDKWSFRDSNWNPDFIQSARKALELYKKEKGFAANEIDGVIGFTPTVIENVLRLAGPIKVDGEEFNATNFTEKLEYEVEYGFAERGLHFNDRKKLLANLASAILSRLKSNIMLHSSDYFTLAQTMLREKQMVIYLTEQNLEKILLANDSAGEIKTPAGDYLLWVDANLVSLKTDAVISRSLNYKLETSEGKLAATASMNYSHQGKIDWRTSRYRTYARIFVPLGSQLLKVEGVYKNALGINNVFDQGVENGHQWFGAFISIEPGKTGQLSFTYILPPALEESVNQGKYQLLIQKQIGTLSPKLTIDLNFAKKPYDLVTDLSIDRSVDLKF